MELGFFGRCLHLGGGFFFEFQVGFEFVIVFLRVWWRLRVLAIVEEEKGWSLFLQNARLFLCYMKAINLCCVGRQKGGVLCL
jgi:hypothetical protein